MFIRYNTSTKKFQSADTPTSPTTAFTDLDFDLAATILSWQSYSPSWTATGTAPSLGSGVLSGDYVKLGQLIIFKLSLRMGSTTTYGTGTYSFSLPVTAHANDLLMMGSALLLDSGTEWKVAGVQKDTSTTFKIYNEGNSGGGIGQTVPFTWADNDEIRVVGAYRAA
jgi:hypothetical protein